MRLLPGTDVGVHGLQLSKLAASIVSKKLSVEKPGQARFAAFEVRLKTLLALLARMSGEGPVSRVDLTVQRAHPLLLELLDVWEAVTAAEAAKAAAEAETFKTKVRETSFKSEEVRP
jgi:hypothetical protein